jgi:hypothetical protein
MTSLGFALALVALLGIARTLWWQYRSPAPARPWRLAVLIGLQLASALLLWRILEPPERQGRAGTLIVATAGAPRRVALATGDVLVALPEAPDLPGAAHVPDLATALRRHPGTTRLRIIGHGLPPRDQIATGLPLDFDPAPLPRGLVWLSSPANVAPGAQFHIGGSVHDIPAGRVVLRDPASRIVATAPLDAAGNFTLSATTKTVGPAEFSLQTIDRNRRLVEAAVVPVVATEAPQPRIQIVAGAAGPDLKYLRRWAQDAGLAVSTSVAAGNGLEIGDAAAQLDAASLGKTDLLVLDERSWATLDDPARARLLAAVQAGMGLVLRITGPVPDTVRRDWAALGFASDDMIGPLRLSGTTTALAQVTTRAIGSDTAPLLRSTSGEPVGIWRTLGRGRIGVWPVIDLYTLVLAGDAGQHAALWSGVFGTLARPLPQPTPRISPEAAPGQRVTLCQLGPPASVRHPDGAITSLVVDQGCAAFWPQHAGWHELRASGTAPQAFLVTPIGTGRLASQAQSATQALADPGTATAVRSPVRGASWPWFIAWVVAVALLWGLERSRFGRTAMT